MFPKIACTAVIRSRENSTEMQLSECATCQTVIVTLKTKTGKWTSDDKEICEEGEGRLPKEECVWRMSQECDTSGGVHGGKAKLNQRPQDAKVLSCRHPWHSGRMLRPHMEHAWGSRLRKLF